MNVLYDLKYFYKNNNNHSNNIDKLERNIKFYYKLKFKIIKNANMVPEKNIYWYNGKIIVNYIK
ncbi:hypothetical protein PFNF135_06241 [Plasmodium falciparum NF135/5.C10]|uniref:Uncharacterized protein n=2 Tax=Plasmodium falciparum TaxID=5833 RepID=A0A024UXB8_PLAFA|nr:hypothetical protein PFFVO_06186 [Plasmodium falciparum Vietnam Oak-Knoll (FVO)]ETW39377.1 hypothetical protein PFNF135_06241 [Plasmodium falciparum NF135/5.C10]